MIRLPAMLWFIATLWSYPITTTVVNTIVMNKSPQQTLAYAGNVSRWPEWHPQSEKVVTQQSSTLAAGDQFAEQVSTPIGQNELSWTVEQYQPGMIWQASADNQTNGSIINLTYTVAATDNNETQFERRLEYTLPNFALVAANAMYFKEIIEEKSERSLQRLQTAVNNL